VASPAFPSTLRRWLSQRELLVRVAGNSSWLLLDQGVRLVIGTVLSIWMARALGPEQLGAWGWAMALVALFAPLSTLGLEVVAVRDLRAQPALLDETLSSALTLRAAGGLLGLLCSTLLALVLRPQETELALLVAVGAFAAVPQALSVVDLVFQARIAARDAVLARSAALLVASALKAWILSSRLPLLALAAASVAEALFSGAALAFALRRHEGRSVSLLRASLPRLRAYLAACLPLALTGLTIAIYSRVDRILLGRLSGNTAVAELGVAAMPLDLVLVLPAVAHSSLYPAFVDLYRRSEQEYTERLVQVMAAAFWGATAICLLLQPLAGPLIELLFGAPYRGSATLLRVLSLGLLITAPSVVFSHRFVLQGRQSLPLLGTTAGAVVCILLDLLWIPPYGAMGAVLADLVAALVPTLVITAFADRSVGRIFLRAILLRSRHLRGGGAPF
jgi:polysaccharide transporter, PST family